MATKWVIELFGDYPPPNNEGEFPAYVAWVRTVIAFCAVLLVVVLLTEMARLIYRLWKRTRFKTPKKEIAAEIANLANYHQSMEQRIRDRETNLPNEIKGVWLEYILTDLVKALNQAFGRQGFRASIFVPYPNPENPGETHLISVASSTFHPTGSSQTLFVNGEGFCGACFKDRRPVAGARNLLGIKFLPINKLFADNQDDIRKPNDRKRSFLCLPISMRTKSSGALGEAVGVLCIDSRNSRDFCRQSNDVQFVAREVQRTALLVIGNHIVAKRYDNG